ncbi:MAG: hypothetical protein U0183_22620 [Polyangiaceae bacterium]
MAYLHVLREAAGLLDAGATYSHRGALGRVAGTLVVVRLVYRGDRSAEPWWTRVEVALPTGAPLDLVIEERDGPVAERLRASFASGEVDVEELGARFRCLSPWPGAFPSRSMRERLLRTPSVTVRAVAAISPSDGADPQGTTDGTGASEHLRGAPVLQVESPEILEATDLEHLVALAYDLSAEVRTLVL